MTDWNDETILPFGREELNLIEAPWTRLHYERTRAPQTIETENWKITSSSANGLPGPHALETYWALCSLAKMQDLKNRQVNFSAYHLIRHILGWPYNGRSYQRLKRCIESLHDVAFHCKRWKITGSRATVQFGFHLVDEYSLLTDGAGGHGQGAFAYDHVLFSRTIWDALKQGSLKKLDLGVLRNLHRPLSKRLYSYLDKHLYKKPVFTIRLSRLTTQYMGMSERTGPRKNSALWKSLRNAVEELVDIGFIEPPKIERRGDEWVLSFSRPLPLFDASPRELPYPHTPRADSFGVSYADRRPDYECWVSEQLEAYKEDLTDEETEQVETEVVDRLAEWTGPRSIPLQARMDSLRRKVLKTRLGVPDFEDWKSAKS